MKKKLFLLTLGFLFSINFSYGNYDFNQAFGETNTSKDQAKLDKLTKYLDTLFENNKFMGSLSINRNNEIIYSKSYGFSFISDKEKKQSNSETKYRIGSISKMFTSVMIFQLLEEKKLTLDTKLSNFFPEVKNSEKITIDNLLNHRSGIHNFTNNESYLSWNTKYKSKEEMLKIIVEGGSDFEPDSSAEYSNSNYILLGYIIEKLSGKTYKENLKERITSKIALKNTYFGDKTNIQNNEAYSYVFLGQKYIQEPETDMSIPHGAGSIVSTPTDLTEFITALFNGKFISKNSLEQMTSLKDNYGRGIFKIPFYEKFAFGHNGSIDKFSSDLAYFEKDKIAVSFIANSLNYSMNKVLLGVLSIYNDKDFEIPVFKKIKVNSNILKKYQGIYSADKFPLKITIKVENDELIAQATGQPSFILDAISESEFEFVEAGIKINFSIEKNEFYFKQGSYSNTFKKEIK